MAGALTARERVTRSVLGVENVTDAAIGRDFRYRGLAIDRCSGPGGKCGRHNSIATPMRTVLQVLASVVSALLLGGCLTDAATRLAYDIEAGAGRVGRAEGATYTLVHRVPSSAGECVGPYTVQLDKVGAIIVWCKDAAGDATVSSHSTSYHGRFVDTPQKRIVDKLANEALVIDLERRDRRTVVAEVRYAEERHQ